MDEVLQVKAKDKIKRNAPILRFLVPLIFAYFIAAKFDFMCRETCLNLAVALVFFARGITFYLCEKIFLKKICEYAFILFLAMAYFGLRCPPTPYPDFAARQMELSLSVISASKTQNGGFSGTAKILSAPSYFSKAKTISFFAQNSSREIFKGDVISAEFIVRPLDENEDFDRYLKRTRIFFKAYSAKEITFNERSKISEFFFEDCRNFISKKLSLLPKDYFNFTGIDTLKAIILGDKSLLSKRLKKDLSNTGSMHIFAVSGLHIGIAAGALFFMLALLRVPKKVQPFISLPLLFVYVAACAMPPSAMRAFIMATFLWLAYALGRGSKAFSAVCAAAFVSLIFSPSDLFNAGFQLSYCVVCAILLWGVDFATFANAKIRQLRGFELKKPSFFKRTFNKSVEYVVGVCVISMAALFVSAPITSETFGIIAVLSVPLSIFFISFATLAVSLGAVAVILPEIIAQYINVVSAQICSAMVLLAQAGAQSDIVLNVKISPECAFLIEFAIFVGLIFMPKISGAKKFLILPLTCLFGIFLTYL